jgi:hypothetical protein
MWDITIPPPQDELFPALISNVIAQLNMPYIVRFGSYCPHGFVLGDASPLLRLTPQNTYNMSTIGFTHKVLALDARFRYGILQLQSYPKAKHSY